MNPTPSNDGSSSEQAKPAKKPYQSPQLRDYGTIAEQTNSGGSGSPLGPDGPNSFLYITGGN